MPSLIGGGFLPHLRSAALPSPISFHAGSSSHRLKKLEKWNRRGGDCNTCSSSFHHISKWMDGLMPHGNSASEQFGCKSCLYSPDCEETCAEHEKYTSRSTENIFKAAPSEDLDIFFNENVDLEVQELEAAFSGILHLHDTGEPFFTNPTSNEDNIFKQEMNPLYLDANMLKNMSKCGTIPCSEVIQSYHLNLGVKELSNTVVHIDNVLKADNPTHSYLPTLPSNNERWIHHPETRNFLTYRIESFCMSALGKTPFQYWPPEHGDVDAVIKEAIPNMPLERSEVIRRVSLIKR